jgi:UrcA family protein
METSMKTVITSALPSAGITAAIFGALGLSCGALSAAADGSEAPQAVVQYSDLNVSNPQDALELYNRIAAAADKACTSYAVDGRSLSVYAWMRTCVHNAVADVVLRIDEPELFAVYNAKNHRPLPSSVAIAQTR